VAYEAEVIKPRGKLTENERK